MDEIIDRKLDLLMQAIMVVPMFTYAIESKNRERDWARAAAEMDKIKNQYQEILKYEYNNNPTDKQD